MTTYPPMPSRLETERLTLRPWSPSDAPALRALHAERGTEAESLAYVRGLIGAMIERIPSDGIALLPVRLREAGGGGGGEGDLIGYCGLIVGRSSLEEPEIAYEFFRRSHGNGYATEAARAVVDAVAGTGRTRIWATVRPWNEPSFRVLDRLGFVRDRTTTDGRGELVWLVREL
ncbi:GNAT family N-acetyltransferase [Streptomyces sp. NPDC001493]